MEETNPKTYVFVLMPFSEAFTDVYELGIKAACKNVGAYCERVDEQIFDGNILERVYNQIAKADIIIAEMSGRNPNVFYETGYAHALNKRVILLTQNAEDIPFDLKHFPHIIYRGKISFLKQQLKARVHWCIENPRGDLARVATELQLYVNGVSLEDKPELDIPPALGNGYLEYTVTLSVHNETNKVISSDSYELALIALAGVSILQNSEPISEPVELPHGQYVLSIGQTRRIFPDGWHSIKNLQIRVSEKALYRLLKDAGFIRPVRLEILLRLFTELTSTDFPFLVTIDDALTVYQCIKTTPPT
jgi:hypothetical protein